MLYSPTASLNGAKLLLTKSAKKVTIEMASRAYLQAPILTPHALPMFRDEGEARAGGAGGKRKRDKERMDKRKTRRPEAPMTGPGRGGRVGASATQHVVQNLVRDTTRDEDVSLFLIVLFSCIAGSENVGIAPLSAHNPEIETGAVLESDTDASCYTPSSRERRCSSMRRERDSRCGLRVSRTTSQGLPRM